MGESRNSNIIMEQAVLDIINTVNDALWSYLLIGLLLGAAIYFTVRTRGVQFRMFGEMCRILAESGGKYDDARSAAVDGHHKISSFQAFAVSIASRVGTGNLAGVATAIAIGGPGSVFWMWVVALLGSANAFIESTLAQLYKIYGPRSFVGGPAYYILKGLRCRSWAVVFAVLITLTFGLAFNSVQSNTIAQSMSLYNIDSWVVGLVLTVLTVAVVWGGIQRISRFSEIVVPVMAVAYIILAVTVLAMNWQRIPDIFALIFDNAFSWHGAAGGAVGSAIMMGVKRGLFSNEAGEGSTPNAAATAAVSHPVKQGFVQTLGVYTDTLLICTCTAFIILASGVFDGGASGIVLTQQALDSELGVGLGTAFVSIAVFFFAFTSIVANYYYGETNLMFIMATRPAVLGGARPETIEHIKFADVPGSHATVVVYRLLVAGMVMLGSVMSLDTVWALADLMMALMTVCNIAAILPLGKYAVVLLHDYIAQRRRGLDPVYDSSTLPAIADRTPAWSAPAKA